MVWRELSDPARRLGGDEWGEEGKRRLLGALTKLRDAEARRERLRDEPESDRGIQAARRQRASALAADGLSRELFGLPLAAFLQRAEAGAIEEVPPG